MQRFQLAVWPDTGGVWKNVDRWPDAEAKNAVFEIFTRLADLSPEDMGATVPEDGGVPYLRFSSSAQDEFDTWRTELEHRLRSDSLAPCLESHIAKYRSLVPCLSLVFHCIEGGYGPVPVSTLRRAIRWAEYLESHANRIYAGSVHPERHSARELARRIKAGELGTQFVQRDVYQCGWSGLSSKEEVAGAVKILISLGWLAEREESTSGRPKTWLVVNPAVLDSGPAGENKSGKSNKSTPSVGFAGFVGDTESGFGQSEALADEWGEV